MGVRVWVLADVGAQLLGLTGHTDRTTDLSGIRVAQEVGWAVHVCHESQRPRLEEGRIPSSCRPVGSACRFSGLWGDRGLKG